MVTVNEFEKQCHLETEVECLKDTIGRLAERVLILENFIKAKHGQTALDELPLLASSDLHNEFIDMFFTTPEISHTTSTSSTLPAINSTTTTVQSSTTSMETETHEFVITVPSTTGNQKIEICSNQSQSQEEEEEDPVSDDDDFDEENPSEIVPDAIREETITENGANIDIINVYQGDIPEDMNFSSNPDYTQVVTYDVIPTNIVFNEKQVEEEQEELQQQQTQEISITLPPMKNPGEIRIYKPELKRFTTVPATIEMSAMQYHCEECSRDFRNTHNLNLHKAKHERQRVKKNAEVEKKLNLEVKGKKEFQNLQFKCSYCHLRYPTATKRKLHEKTHTSDKKFICDECGLGFRHKAGLTDHKIGHTGIRNHVCHLCPASFLRSRNCLKHIRFVHGLVQIKTVVDGKRVVEFVNPEVAALLIEERKNNQESKESINSRRIQRRKLLLLQQQQQQQDSNKKSNTSRLNNNSNHKNPNIFKKQKEESKEEEDSNSDIDVSEEDIIEDVEDVLQHIKVEAEEDDDENMLSS